MRALGLIAAALLLVVAACGGPAPSPSGQPSAATPGASPASLPTELILGQTIWAYYDPAVERVVLVNGAQEQGPAKPTELWSWDGSAWELLDAAGPEARAIAAVGRDPERGVVVVQGGISSSGTEFDETLEWDGTDWTAHPGTDAGPGSREGAGLAWDPAIGADGALRRRVELRTPARDLVVGRHRRGHRSLRPAPSHGSRVS